MALLGEAELSAHGRKLGDSLIRRRQMRRRRLSELSWMLKSDAGTGCPPRMLLGLSLDRRRLRVQSRILQAVALAG